MLSNATHWEMCYVSIYKSYWDFRNHEYTWNVRRDWLSITVTVHVVSLPFAVNVVLFENLSNVTHENSDDFID